MKKFNSITAFRSFFFVLILGVLIVGGFSSCKDDNPQDPPLINNIPLDMPEVESKDGFIGTDGKVNFTLTNASVYPSGTVFRVFEDNDYTVHLTVTAKLSGSTLTLSCKSGKVAQGTYYIDAIPTRGKFGSEVLQVKVWEAVPEGTSWTPVFENDEVMKRHGSASVDLVLDNGHFFADGTLFIVFKDSAGSTVHDTVTAKWGGEEDRGEVFDRRFALTCSTGDIESTTYYISAEEPGKIKSILAAVTVKNPPPDILPHEDNEFMELKYTWLYTGWSHNNGFPQNNFNHYVTVTAETSTGVLPNRDIINNAPPGSVFTIAVSNTSTETEPIGKLGHDVDGHVEVLHFVSVHDAPKARINGEYGTIIDIPIALIRNVNVFSVSVWALERYVIGAWIFYNHDTSIKEPTPTPVFSASFIAKEDETQDTVDFTLADTPAFAAGTVFKVYSGLSGGAEHASVEAIRTGTTLSLKAKAPATDVPAGDYYISATEPGEDESLGRAKITVGPFIVFDPWETHPYKNNAAWDLEHAYTALRGDEVPLWQLPINNFALMDMIFEPWRSDNSHDLIASLRNDSVLTMLVHVKNAWWGDGPEGVGRFGRHQGEHTVILNAGKDNIFTSYNENTMYKIDIPITSVRNVLAQEEPWEGALEIQLWDGEVALYGMWLYKNMDENYVEPTPVPQFVSTAVSKEAEEQSGVNFTLNSEPVTGTVFKVYTALTGGSEHTTVEAEWNSGTTLTLKAKTGNDIPAATYYVSATIPERPESTRIALTINGYVEPGLHPHAGNDAWELKHEFDGDYPFTGYRWVEKISLIRNAPAGSVLTMVIADGGVGEEVGAFHGEPGYDPELGRIFIPSNSKEMTIGGVPGRVADIPVSIFDDAVDFSISMWGTRRVLGIWLYYPTGAEPSITHPYQGNDEWDLKFTWEKYSWGYDASFPSTGEVWVVLWAPDELGPIFNAASDDSLITLVIKGGWEGGIGTVGYDGDDVPTRLIWDPTKIFSVKGEEGGIVTLPLSVVRRVMNTPDVGGDDKNRFVFSFWNPDLSVLGIWLYSPAN